MSHNKLLKLELYRRIENAKSRVRFSVFNIPEMGGDQYAVENYDEILKVLGYEDTLGLSLFVTHYIAKNIPSNHCIRFLIKN